MTTFSDDTQCFVCGPLNPLGLKLTFHREGEEYVTTVTFSEAFQGYAGIVHGGLLATVLDEVMARYVWEEAGLAATGKIAVNFRRPAPTGVPITIRGIIVNRRGRVFECAATANLADGTLLADAVSTVIKIRGTREK